MTDQPTEPSTPTVDTDELRGLREGPTDYTDPRTIDVDVVIGEIKHAEKVRSRTWTDRLSWPNVTVAAMADEILRLRARPVPSAPAEPGATEVSLEHLTALVASMDEARHEYLFNDTPEDMHAAGALGAFCGPLMRAVEQLTAALAASPAPADEGRAPHEINRLRSAMAFYEETLSQFHDGPRRDAINSVLGGARAVLAAFDSGLLAAAAPASAVPEERDEETRPTTREEALALAAEYDRYAEGGINGPAWSVRAMHMRVHARHLPLAARPAPVTAAPSCSCPPDECWIGAGLTRSEAGCRAGRAGEPPNHVPVAAAPTEEEAVSRPERDDYDSWLSHYNALVAWLVEQAGRRIVPGYEEGATRFCPECDACGSPNGEPVRGLDSYGDCADDGEHVVWTLPASPVPEPGEGDETTSGDQEAGPRP